MTTYSQMVCLVGENPLPIYLGIRQFADKDATVVLVHSDETKKQAENIKAVIGSDAQIRLERLVDPFAPISVGAVMDDLEKRYPHSLLNYTGGTKVMSAYSLMSWHHRPECLVYLDERKRLFRFGNGVDEILFGASLSVDELCNLHGVDPGKTSSCPPCDIPDLVNILENFRSLPELREQNNPSAWLKSNATEWKIWTDLLSPGTQTEWQQKNIHGKYQYRFFAKHQWLEELVRKLILGLEKTGDHIHTTTLPSDPLVLPDKVRCGTRFTIQQQEFESDVMTVLGQTLRYVSVSTVDTEGYIKGKSFEAMHRARQLGGDLARSCVVCLANSTRIDKCQRSVNDSQHELFGLNDVQEWIQGHGRTLRHFLTG